MKTFKLYSPIVKLALMLLISTFFIQSCGSDDDSSSGSECESGTIADQPAQGIFSGESYTYTGGYYRQIGNAPDETYFFKLFANEFTGDICSSFDDTQSILFGFDSIEPQSLALSLQNTVNFNTISSGSTNAELATCGRIEIVSIAADGTVSGKLIAEGSSGSTINGNFTAVLCD